MKRMIMVGVVAVAVVSTYSFVYACDHSQKTTRATTAEKKGIRTVVVESTTACKSVDKSQVMTFEFDVPSQDASRFVRVIEHEKESADSPSTLRTAVTLGRAFVTTVGAIVSSLMTAANHVTAALV